MHAAAMERRVYLAELGDSMPTGPPETVRPKSLTIDLTLRCPFRCPGCIERKAMGSAPGASLAMGTVRRIIECFAAQGGEEILLYGGEPTAYRQFDHVALLVASLRLRLKVVTNGAFLHQRRVADALVQAAERVPVECRVSLNAGTAATHGEVHRASGHFPRVVAGMQGLKGSGVRLGVSFLLQEANAAEVLRAFEIAGQVGASDFWLRPMSGIHGIGVLPLSGEARFHALQAIHTVRSLGAEAGLAFHVPAWHVAFLERGVEPDTRKTYPTCYYCAASRLVATPPEPGLVWGCTYWRAEPRFLVADLARVAFGSEAFERRRRATVRRVCPPADCAGVICNRHDANKVLWESR